MQENIHMILWISLLSSNVPSGLNLRLHWTTQMWINRFVGSLQLATTHAYGCLKGGKNSIFNVLKELTAWDCSNLWLQSYKYIYRTYICDAYGSYFVRLWRSRRKRRFPSQLFASVGGSSIIQVTIKLQDRPTLITIGFNVYMCPLE